LQNIASDFRVEVSPERPETMAYLGQDQVRCKIVVEDKCLQKVKNVKYLCRETSYEYDTFDKN